MLEVRFRGSQVRIAAAGITVLVALGACGSKVDDPPPGTGGGGAGTGTGTSDTTTSTGLDCRACACDVFTPAGGCGDVCGHAQISGPPYPFLCDGGFLYADCQMCLAKNCGLTDPSTCRGLQGAACSSNADCWNQYCKNGTCT